ncbi:MAG: hypothetical protein FWE15_04665 [Actinomycetia bacterium]|nr:hypothetical protein [Actinomycetes bacterium]
MSDVSIGGSLPVGDNDGLTAIASELIAEPDRLRVMLAVVDVAKVTTKTDDGGRTATVRIRRIEQVLPVDLPAAERLMRRSLERRTGRETLPLELEDELEMAFAGIDLDSPDDDGGDGEPDDGDVPGEDEDDDDD